MPNPTTHFQTRTGACILYAEDEENDVFFLRHALEVSELPHRVESVGDGRQAIDYLAGVGEFADRQRHPFPNLALLDINMPKMSGLEVLAWIHRQPWVKSLTVLMLTSSSREQDMDAARQLGAADYLLKPSDPLALVGLLKAIDKRWLACLSGNDSD